MSYFFLINEDESEKISFKNSSNILFFNIMESMSSTWNLHPIQNPALQ